MPFALAHPDAEVIGVDLSPQQIAHGRELVAKIGLKNLDLRAMSLTDIDASFGKFDYIICHGVFSWVPPEVRDAILRICRETSVRKASPISATTRIRAGKHPTWCGTRCSSTASPPRRRLKSCNAPRKCWGCSSKASGMAIP